MTPMNSLNRSPSDSKGINLASVLPIFGWLRDYDREYLVGDVLAGIIVTIMLVPQSMAYAMLAGLPPEVGLYASILPLIIYGLLGTSRTLAVGPVAIVSLLVASGVGALAEPGSGQYIQFAITLALLVGVIQFVMGAVRLGFLVNFLSHPVISGFTSAAALVIGFSQLKHLLGIPIPRTEHFYEQFVYVAKLFGDINLATVGIGLLSIGILLYFKMALGDHLKMFGLPESLVMPITKSAPLVVVVLGTLLVAGFNLHETGGVSIVGDVPAGLPALTIPTLDPNIWQALLPTALAISFVGYMESISVAKALASKRREKVDANQELVALGAANFGATLTGGYPVTGGFSRSVVNFAAGARTGLASIITAVLMGATVLFLTPLFYLLPTAVLASIIMVAVFGLIDMKTLRHVWAYNKADAAALIITFLAVLTIGVETGILVGAGVSLVMYLWRTSRPHVAIVGRISDSETYRNIKRHEVETCQHCVAVRVDESLYFANTKFLEDTVLGIVADRPEVDHFLLIGSAINFIDASALETLESLMHELGDAGVEFHMAEIKGPVMDRLRAIGFVDQIGEDHIYLSTHDAMKSLRCVGSNAAHESVEDEAAREEHPQTTTDKVPAAATTPNAQAQPA